MNSRQYHLVILLWAVAMTGYCAGSERVTLETVRELVARNEALIDPIKLAYTVRKSRAGERLLPARGKKRGVGRSYSHINYVWAQSGEKHYVKVDYFYGPNEPGRSVARVFDRQLMTRVDLPDLMQGTISPRDRHDWYYVIVAKLGLRPFEGCCKLSQILIPEYASLHTETEMVDGRETYVIDAKRPSVFPYFARIWIDRKRGMPLRIWYFGRHPNWDDAGKMGEINEIKLHQLPNGGWMPVRGVRSINLQDGAISYEHITVDVGSITIQSEDIPESLFKIDFPDGASIYDTVSGLKTIEGQSAKTYEQVVGARGKFIAGTIVNENGSPIPGIVVGPFSVKTQQSDGRHQMRIIQSHDRPCAITDTKGRFAVELEQDGSYDLWVFPKDFVDVRLHDVPLGKHDLKVVLSKGGAVTGRVVRLVNGRKVPVANAEVMAKAGDRVLRATPRLHRLETKTDSEGRFEIKCLEMLMPKRRAGSSSEQQQIPHIWQIVCGRASETVQFDSVTATKAVELLIKPPLHEARPLVGRALPGLENIKINLIPSQIDGKMMLICMFDMQQRPSRNDVLQLASKSDHLEQAGVRLAAVQAVKVDEKVLTEWVREHNIPFPIGMIYGREECFRFDWAVCSLPWLILTNNRHVVTAEGFGLSELDAKIEQINGD